ncbi:MAG: sulfotransferase [Desulfobacteraceae bacterium]|nr:sulfotransferase [Desulfobacteraceae bacterium]
MVDLILGNDPRAFSLGEVHAWFRPFRSHHFKIICSCGRKNCPWEQLKKFSEDEFYQKCFDWLDVDILVDSSKNLPWVIDNNLREKRNNITVYNVLLFKEPINFYHSYWKRGTRIDKAREYFKKYYLRFFSANLPYITLNYNELVADPAGTIEALCNALEIPYFEGKERFWNKEHHQVFGSMGTRKQVEKAQSQIRKQEEFPPEYKKLIPAIRSDDEKDKILQDILCELKSNDLKLTNRTKSIQKPYWYYLSKLKQKYRQRFPQEWKYDQ